jgi:hypothetical protein
MNWHARLVLSLAAGLAGISVVAFLYVALRRMGYPFDLEWMEGSIVEHVQRVLDGKPIYASPSVEFVPYLYNPLYYYASALAAKLLGNGYFTLRLVSFCCTLALFATLYDLVARETKSRISAGLAMGVLAATFGLNGQWFDLARTDALFMALLLGSAWCVRFAERKRGLLVGAALFCLAFLAKQMALPSLLALALGAWALRGFRRSLWFTVPAVLLTGGSVLCMNLWTGGWYWYYAFMVPFGHTTSGREALFLDFWRVETLAQLPVPTLAFVVLLCSPQRGARRGPWLFYVLFCSCQVIATYLIRTHAGSYLNDLIPAHVALCVAFGLVLAAGFERAKDLGQSLLERATIIGGIVAAVQLAALMYDPRAMLPSAADRQAGMAFVERIREVPGEVFIPQHPNYARLAGKSAHAAFQAVSDMLLLEADPFGAKPTFYRAFHEAFASHRFSTIVLDHRDRWFFVDDLQEYYRPAGVTWFEQPDVFFPITGGPCRPDWVYVPARP